MDPETVTHQTRLSPGLPQDPADPEAEAAMIFWSSYVVAAGLFLFTLICFGCFCCAEMLNRRLLLDEFLDIEMPSSSSLGGIEEEDDDEDSSSGVVDGDDIDLEGGGDDDDDDPEEIMDEHQV